MRQALYRKYRPKTLSEVAGQDYVKITLGNQLAAGQVGHAYLFTGPKGTGKTTVARILAKSVNCLEPKKGEPCGKCAMCEAFDNEQMFDVIEIDAASNNSVENVRDLIAKINLVPTIGKYKIYILDEAHQLSKSASNALLKTLEEPPAHAIFVLATTESEKLLPTIISRCQRFDFRYVPTDEVVKYLGQIAKAEKIKISSDGLEFIAGHSGGGVRDAVGLLEQASFIEGEITQATLTDWLGLVDWQTIYEMTEWLVKNNSKEILAKIDDLYHSGCDLNRLTASWVAMWRQILAVKLGNGGRLPIAKDQVSQLTLLSKELSVQKILTTLQELMWAGREMKGALVPQVPLEVAVVKLTQSTEESVVSKNEQEPPEPPSSASIGEESPVAASDEAPKERVSQQTGITSDELGIIWPKVLDLVRSSSQTLAATLARAQVGVDAGAVVVKFTSRFHKEKLEQRESYGLLKGAFQELGCDAKIICAIEVPPAEEPVDAQNISEVFGGTV